MSYKKQLTLLSITSALLLMFIGWSGYINEFVNSNCLEIQGSLGRCVGIVFYFEHQSVAMVLTALLLSITPLFFLKEHVYKAWRKYAIIALPIVAILIFLAPEYAPGDYITIGYDREFASLFFSTLFLLISWLIALWGYVKERKNK